MDKEAQPKKKFPFNECMLGIIVILLIVCVYKLVTDKKEMVAAKPEAVAETNSGKPDFVLENIASETAALHAKPPATGMRITEKAQQCKDAIKAGDYTKADAITHEIIAHSTMDYWHYSPFNWYIAAVATDGDPAFLTHLTDWVEKSKSSIAYLVRAKYYYDTGWQIRGHKFTDATRPEHLAAFGDYMEKAAADANKSIELETNPYGYFLLLKTIASNGNTPQMETAFLAAIKKFPKYYALYEARLDTLSPKWGGKPSVMIFFVNKYALLAPDNSPLKLLYIKLYANLLNTAFTACEKANGDEKKPCVTEQMDAMVTPALQTQVTQAFSLYKKTAPIEFSQAVEPLLSDMVFTPGGADFAGKMLQTAADAMGTENRMIEKNPGHNNYMLDRINAKVWYNNGNYDNAEKKYNEAIQDLNAAPFPNEEKKDGALAGIYDDLSTVYNKTAQYDKMIAYQNAATILGGNSDNDFRQLKCFGYYKLKKYTKAVEECTTLLSLGENFQTRYWRGASYEALGQKKEALDDFMIVAESEDPYRTWAAIKLTFIYSQQNELTKELDYFNSHPFLFDEEHELKSNLAINYNNRCYIYKEQGELQKALDDCQASLRFGNLPDAYQKQQELLKALKQKEATQN